MKLCTFRLKVAPSSEGWPGVIEADHVVRLPGDSLRAYLGAGQPQPVGPEYPLSEVELLAPIPEPPSLRDFFVFEQHVATARRNRGAEVPPEWYDVPVFYFSNPAAIIGPDELVVYPEGTRELDYELEAAAVIGADGDIAGFTILNDWSARDVQLHEVRVGLGPSKAKDFATSIGPVIVTVDEFHGRSGLMTAKVNGEERSRGNLADMHYTWEQIRAHAARNTRLRPGDVIGSGTVGSGCVLELNDGRWIRPGDTVVLEVEGIGVLRNTVVDPFGRADQHDGTDPLQPNGT